MTPESNQIHRNRKQKSGCQGLQGGGNEEVMFNGYRVSVGEDEKVLELVDGDCRRTMRMY